MNNKITNLVNEQTITFFFSQIYLFAVKRQTWKGVRNAE